jgi:hypothetical protein
MAPSRSARLGLAVRVAVTWNRPFSIANTAPWAQTYIDSRTLVDALRSRTLYSEEAICWLPPSAPVGRNLADKRYASSSQNVDPSWIWTLNGEPRYVGLQMGLEGRQVSDHVLGRKRRKPAFFYDGSRTNTGLTRSVQTQALPPWS